MYSFIRSLKLLFLISLVLVGGTACSRVNPSVGQIGFGLRSAGNASKALTLLQSSSLTYLAMQIGCDGTSTTYYRFNPQSTSTSIQLIPAVNCVVSVTGMIESDSSVLYSQKSVTMYSGKSAALDLQSGTTQNVDITLNADSALTVKEVPMIAKIFDSAGNPVSSSSISLLRKSDGVMFSDIYQTNAKGVFYGNQWAELNEKFDFVVNGKVVVSNVNFSVLSDTNYTIKQYVPTNFSTGKIAAGYFGKVMRTDWDSGDEDQDGTTNGSQMLLAQSPFDGTAFVDFKNQKSNNAGFSVISFSSGTLSPSFTAGTTSYSLNIDNTISSITFQPSLQQSKATVTYQVGNGTPVAIASGATSAAIPLSYGANTITFTVTAEDGSTTKTFTIQATRSLSNNANLASLSLSVGTLTPSLDASVIAYTATVSYATTTMTFTPTVLDALTTVKVNGTLVSSGTASGSISLNVGSNAIPVLLTAQDGSTKTYTVTVYRKSNDPSLSSLTASGVTISPTFASATTSYTGTVPYATTSATITPTTTQANAVVTVNGTTVTSGQSSSAIALSVGANAITVLVTAEDSSFTRTYTLNLTRTAPSATDTLSSLTTSISTLSSTFTSGTTSYSLNNQMSSLGTTITVTPTVTDANSTIQVKINSGSYASVSSGTASASLTPTSGSNTLYIYVLAQDGSTNNTYTITFSYGACAAGYYDSGDHSCQSVGIGNYSAGGSDTPHACSNGPANSIYTSPTATGSTCPWSCSTGYISNGSSCSSYPNATILACANSEIAVGISGRSGAIIDRIGVRCAAFSGSAITGSAANGPDYGGNGGSPFTQDCPSGYGLRSVNGFLATYIGVFRTGEVRIDCIKISDGTVSGYYPSGTFYGGTTDRGAFNFTCGTGNNPFGTYANGIIIDNAAGAAYAGDTLGITCR